jgi:hypothetical protein
MFEIPEELAEKLEQAAARKHQTVIELLESIVEETISAADIYEQHKRDEVKARLIAAGALRVPSSSAQSAKALTSEELREIGTLPLGSPSTTEILRQLRDTE